jgi:diadenosine tetraphosphate (Ap4A) HIT family hydrolase
MGDQRSTGNRAIQRRWRPANGYLTVLEGFTVRVPTRCGRWPPRPPPPSECGKGLPEGLDDQATSCTMPPSSRPSSVPINGRTTTATSLLLRTAFREHLRIARALRLPTHELVKAVSLAMKTVYACDGGSTRQHTEPAGNQDVWHYHVPVTPRYRDDRFLRQPATWCSTGKSQPVRSRRLSAVPHPTQEHPARRAERTGKIAASHYADGTGAGCPSFGKPPRLPSRCSKTSTRRAASCLLARFQVP